MSSGRHLRIVTMVPCLLQEFECGVSVAGSDRQEWSFTLYDFDGRGNITKEVSETTFVSSVARN